MIEYGKSQQDAGGLPRGRRVPRLLAWTAVAAAVLLVAGALTAYAAYRDVFGKIHRVRVTGLGKRPRSYDNSMNILVIGSDSRWGRNRRFGAHVSGQRSDTILVLHLSPGLRRAVVLSIPRDSVVPVLACRPAPGFAGQAAQPGQVEQINGTFAAGGPGCLWKTIEQTTRIRLTDFMELNFAGFEQVINDLGGVTICLPYAIHDPKSGLRLSRGLHHVMGAQALAYWRARYIGMGSDLERIMRDQYLMASIAQSVKHTDLLGDPVRLFRVVSDMAASLTTDSGLSQSVLISLAESLRNLPLRAVHFVQAPVVAYPPNPDWVQWAPQAATLFGAIAHDRKLPRSHRARGHESRSPSRPGSPPGSAAGSAGPAGPAGGSRGGAKPTGLGGVTRKYGGITAGANVCHDSGAFAGPLGGH